MIKLDIAELELEADEYDELGKPKPAKVISEPIEYSKLEVEEDEPIAPIVLTDETITQDQIDEMKMLGMDKPDAISWERWTRLKGVRYEHEFMIHMAASGLPQGEIAKQLNYDQAHVSKVLNTPEVKLRVANAIHEIYGADVKKALKDRALKGISVVDQILDTGKETERASMAKWVLEHTVGKATQDIQVTKTTLVEFIHKIDQMKENQLRDVQALNENLPKPKDHFDTIIEQIIPMGMIVGKRNGGSEGEQR